MKWYWIVILIIVMSTLAWVLYKDYSTQRVFIKKEIKNKIKENISKIPSKYNSKIKIKNQFDKIYHISLHKKTRTTPKP